MCLCLCLCLCLCMYISFSLSSLGDSWCCPLPQHIGKFPDLRRMFYGGRINGDNHTTNQPTTDRVNIEQSARFFATTWKKTRFKKWRPMLTVSSSSQSLLLASSAAVPQSTPSQIWAVSEMTTAEKWSDTIANYPQNVRWGWQHWEYICVVILNWINLIQTNKQ